MAGGRRLSALCIALLLAVTIFYNTDMIAEAGSVRNYLNDFNGGASAILDPGATNASEIIDATAREWNLDLTAVTKEEESTLVMANVSNALNVRAEPAGHCFSRES